MLITYIPKLEDLWFREMFLNDQATMSYNKSYGGIISFPKELWNNWYNKWILNNNNEYFYRYLQNNETKEFVGEIAYRFDGIYYLADIIIYSKYRGLGFGKEGLKILCECVKTNNIKVLYDDIAVDNPAIKLFLNEGFIEEYRTDKIIMVKKEL